MSKSKIDKPSHVSKLPTKDAESIHGVPIDDSAIADNRMLVYDAASGTLGYEVGGAGAGDVVGPAGATDLAIAIFNGATGKIIKNSTILIDGNDLKFAAANPLFYINAGATKALELAESGTPTAWLKVEAQGGQITVGAERSSSTAHLLLRGYSTAYVGIQKPGDTTKHALLKATELTSTRTFTFPNATGTFVLLDATQTLANKTLTTPTIASDEFANATHDHSDNAHGGQIIEASISDLAHFVASDLGITEDVIPRGNADGSIQDSVLSISDEVAGSVVYLQYTAAGTRWLIFDNADGGHVLNVGFENNISVGNDIIVSGLVDGVDVAAHHASTTEHGATGAVVGTTNSQILTNKTHTLPQINDTSSDHQYVFAVSELAANRTVTLPLLTGNDEFVFKDHTQTLTNKTAEDLTIADCIGFDGVYDNGNISGEVTIDWNEGNMQEATLTGNVTGLAFTDPPKAGFYHLRLIQDGTGGRTVVWDDVDYWIRGGRKPVVSTAAAARDWFDFAHDGTLWEGAQRPNFATPV